MRSKDFVARYSGVCRCGCGRSIEPGDRCIWRVFRWDCRGANWQITDMPAAVPAEPVDPSRQLAERFPGAVQVDAGR